MKIIANMSSQLAQTLKNSKLTFKSVLELLYQKDPDMVDRLISELEESRPVKAPKVSKEPTKMTPQEIKR